MGMGRRAPRGGHEFGGESDMESVVSATSAFSSHSAPHARGRRMMHPGAMQQGGFPPHDATAGGVPPPEGVMGVPPPIGPKRGFSMGSAEDRADGSLSDTAIGNAAEDGQQN